MKKKYNILKLISDNDKLVELSEFDLIELGQEYPYSNIVNIAINRNHYLNTKKISVLETVNLINKTDNPGLVFTSIIEKAGLQQKKKVFSNKDKSKLDNTDKSENSSYDKTVHETLLKSGTSRKKVTWKKIIPIKSKLKFNKKANNKLKFSIDKIEFKKGKTSKKVKATREIFTVSNKENIETESLNNGIVSEQLAEIYLKQGLKKEAIEMYKRLSLQNPEKSAYFAQILKKITKI